MRFQCCKKKFVVGDKTNCKEIFTLCSVSTVIIMVCNDDTINTYLLT